MEISADLPSRAEGPAFLFSSASITSSEKEVKAGHHIFIFLQFNSDLQEPNCERANKPTCSVDPGPVAIQLSLNLLLASQLHESPAVLHPLSFLGKLPKASIQMTKSFDSESKMRI